MMGAGTGKAWGSPEVVSTHHSECFDQWDRLTALACKSSAHCLHHPWIWPFTGNLLPPHLTCTAGVPRMSGYPLTSEAGERRPQVLGSDLPPLSAYLRLASIRSSPASTTRQPQFLSIFIFLLPH